jgi:hypothetical protein
MAWQKSPPELVAAFASLLARFPAATQRKMFGYPAAFVGGNLVTSLHVDRWVVRLPDDDRGRLLELEGAGDFEPMPGRAMKGFATLPPTMLADPEAVAGWVARAVAFGQTLPPKSG